MLPSPSMTVTRHDVNRAWDTLTRIDREYGTAITHGRFAEKVFHDLMVMADHGDLKQLGAELVDPGRAVLLRYVQQLPASAPGWQTAPQIDPRRIAAGRLLVRGGRHVPLYQRELALGWRNTPKAPETGADTFATGPGEQLRVGPGARKPLVVIRSGARGYAFAELVGEPGREVFLHCHQAPPEFGFTVGQRLTAVVVRVDGAGSGGGTTRRSTNLQGWAIRPA
jgi:hypothetical protein